MSQPTALATADSVIEAAWQLPVDTLQTHLREGRTTDPTLLTVLRIRQSLLFSDAEITSQQEQLHHLTRPGHVPLLYELDAVTSTAAQLRTAHAEAHARLRAICAVIDAHPEHRLAEQLTRDLGRSAIVQPRAEAARARTTATTPAPSVVDTQAAIPAGAPAPGPRAGRG
ncbi:hypothetical protein [Streptomyces yaizuensis]|uniref:Uncharacterized protein n=1 Tax=Streptomyces yaizuensis TaxID=2989713 RepID=A0ABQ5NZ55_9ACTN|nr:hypothetical protein [Streptomyces sp. YSPA8]GLF95544.1 hypothetical protein SYYSPA8_14625 [Streptomyces sp. YSPA8]